MLFSSTSVSFTEDFTDFMSTRAPFDLPSVLFIESEVPSVIFPVTSMLFPAPLNDAKIGTLNSANIEACRSVRIELLQQLIVLSTYYHFEF